jgi:hypothetical protein
MEGLTINTSGKVNAMSKLPRARLTKMQNDLEEFVDGDGHMTREELANIIKEIEDNLTEPGKVGEVGLSIPTLYGTIEGRTGSLSKGEGLHKPTSRRALESIASAVISALAKIIPTIKGGRRTVSASRKSCAKSCRATFSRTAGRRGKSQRRGNTRRRMH